VQLLVGRAGTETVAEAEVATWEPESAAAEVALEEPPVFEAEPEAEPEPAPERAAEPVEAETEIKTDKPDEDDAKETAVVASLHLGEVGDSPLPSDTAVDFDVAEFGYGEREEDVDIEEID